MRLSSSLSIFLSSILLSSSPSLATKNHDPAGLALLSNLASNIPVCAYGCINKLTNVTADAEACLMEGKEDECLCSDDVGHYTAVLACVRKNCTLEESIETARGAWEACGKPLRSRKKYLIAPLSIESLAVLCAFLRLYSRWRLVSGFEVDDFVMMAVVILYFAFIGVGLSAAMIAFGVDIWTVSSKVLGRAFKLFYISESFYISILGLTKLSILCFYLRIFPNRTFRFVTYGAMFWVGLSSFIFVFCQIFQCVPISYVWEGWRKGEFGPFVCLDINTLTYTIAGFSIAQDIFILLMPLPLLLKLNVSRKSRVGIMFMFSLGIFVLITSCIRLWAIYIFGDSVNPTWDYADTIIWTGLEVAVSIIVTSLPAIRVLFSRRRPSPLASHFRNRAGVTSTSSFGNTTVVASWGSAPPYLKRISGVSRISSIVVETPAVEDIEKQETHIDLDDKITGALSHGGVVRPFSEAQTMVGIEHDGPDRARSYDSLGGGHQHVVAKDLKHMPSIDEILNGKPVLTGSSGLTPKASGSSSSSTRSFGGSSEASVSRSSYY
ncbi:CFEM domain-protein [Cladorrhinum sp. PSN259]|nr:CFEM domain-protein [Cladorrhinum sp. PSN259]